MCAQDLIAFKHMGTAHVVDLGALNLGHFSSSMWTVSMAWGAGPTPQLFAVALRGSGPEPVVHCIQCTAWSNPSLVFTATAEKLPGGQEQIALGWTKPPAAPCAASRSHWSHGYTPERCASP